jgi:hypothetical protein
VINGVIPTVPILPGAAATTRPHVPLRGHPEQKSMQPTIVDTGRDVYPSEGERDVPLLCSHSAGDDALVFAALSDCGRLGMSAASPGRLRNPATLSDGPYAVRRSCPAVFDRAAASAGAMASTFATTSTLAPSATINHIGTVATGTAPRLVAKACHTA